MALHIRGYPEAASGLSELLGAEMRHGYENAVHELLTNIKRSCIRGRNAAQTESNMVATCDHIENLADEALSYMDNADKQAPNARIEPGRSE